MHTTFRQSRPVAEHLIPGALCREQLDGNRGCERLATAAWDSAQTNRALEQTLSLYVDMG
jgi:hypothetical protein